MGLDFDVSNFNEDGSGDVYTFGISMPIRMVQYHDSFTWSKYSLCLFPNDLPNFLKNDDIRDEQCWWFFSIKTWLSFFKLTLMDPLIFCWMQSPFSHLKNIWRLSKCLPWTLIKYLPFGIKFFEIQKQYYCCWGIMGMCKESINYSFSNLHVNVSSAFYGT